MELENFYEQEHYFLKRTIFANVQILQKFKLFIEDLNYNVDTFSQLINCFIIILQKSEFEFKVEIINEWTRIKLIIQNRKIVPNFVIDSFIDGFINTYQKIK